MKILDAFSSCRFLLLTVLLCGTIAVSHAAPKKVLVVTVTKGFRHSSIATAEKVLGELAQKSGAFEVDYVRTDDDMAQKMTADALKNYDGVIFANTTGELLLQEKRVFLVWIRAEKVLGEIPPPSAPSPLSPPYAEMLGGEFKVHHTQTHVDCINQDAKHPACRDLGPTFRV